MVSINNDAHMWERQRGLHHKSEDKPGEEQCILQNLTFREQYDYVLAYYSLEIDVGQTFLFYKMNKRNLGCSQRDVFKQQCKTAHLHYFF